MGEVKTGYGVNMEERRLEIYYRRGRIEGLEIAIEDESGHGEE